MFLLKLLYKLKLYGKCSPNAVFNKGKIHYIEISGTVSLISVNSLILYILNRNGDFLLPILYNKYLILSNRNRASVKMDIILFVTLLINISMGTIKM